MEFGKDVQVQLAGLHDEALPALLIQAPSRTIAGFDCVDRDAIASLNQQNKGLQGSETSKKDIVISIQEPVTPPPAAPVPAYDDTEIPYSLSLSMPASPSGFHFSQFRAAAANRDEARVAPAEIKFDVQPVEQVDVHPPRLLKQTRFHSQPILHASKNEEPRRCDSTRDTRFDPFKTFSGRLERQLSNLRGRPQEPIDVEAPKSKISEETEQVPAADRYFDALEGPELDTLRVRHDLSANSDGGASAAERREVAVPAAVPDQRVRDVPRGEQPCDTVEDAGVGATDGVPACEPSGEPRAVVRRAGADGTRVLHLPAQGSLLLRGGPARVLPPGARQLLLRAVDRLPLPRAGRASAGDRGAPRRLVRAHGAHLLPGAQDLRAVDVRRPAPAVQGGQLNQPPLHHRQLRRRAARRQDGPPRGPHLLLRRRARALHGPLRDALPAAPHQRHSPQGAPPRLLPLRRLPQRRLHGLGQDPRRVRLRRQDRVLHRTLLVYVTGRADQLVQGIPVLAGVVGVHVPDDQLVDRDHHVRDGGDQRADAGALDRALGHRHRHGRRAAGDHHVPRLRAQGPLPQRRLHRHHPEEAQVQQDPRALPLLQLRHEGARALRLQAAASRLRLAGVQLRRVRSVRHQRQTRALEEPPRALLSPYLTYS